MESFEDQTYLTEERYLFRWISISKVVRYSLQVIACISCLQVIAWPANQAKVVNFCTCMELAESKQCVVGIILPKWPGHFGSSFVSTDFGNGP